ncbi:MAG: TIGR01777 family oxidoreductase [Flavobacteriaceae bacterium]
MQTGTYLISGGTGLVGSALTNSLLGRGHKVHVLTRSSNKSSSQKGLEYFTWDIENATIDPKAFDGVDYLVQLSGSGILDKDWTPSRRQDLERSRIGAAKLLLSEIQAQKLQLKGVVSTSAVGCYPVHSDAGPKAYTEEEPYDSSHYLGQLCQQWEKVNTQFSNCCDHMSILRFGVVWSNSGGFFKAIKPSVAFFMGAYLGTGTQMMPWIHIDDLVSLICWASDHSGVYNAVAGNISNRDFTLLMRQKMNRFSLLRRIPSWALKPVLGQREIAVLKGQRVSNEKLLKAGFKFKFLEASRAMDHLL